MMPWTLGALLGDRVTLDAARAANVIGGLCLDSRRVVQGDAFVALAGGSTHGLKHTAQAIERGAVCILAEAPLPIDTAVSDRLIAVPGLGSFLGVLADRFFGAPSAAQRIVGVTGTNGKTSMVQLLAQAVDGCGLGPTGTIGTLGVGFSAEIRSGEISAGERTTPDVISVHAMLAQLRERGARVVAMEVSSHALDQGRADGVRFEVAMFSNLTRDHLDYHGDMQAYGAAKARLFAWPGLNAAVVNIDDPFGLELADRLPKEVDVWRVSTLGSARGRLTAKSIRLDGAGVGFDLCEDGNRIALRSPLLGRFNVENLLAVGACLRAMGVEMATLATILSELEPVRGRMTRVGLRGAHTPVAAALVVVDYAHTPDALAQALSSLRAHTTGQLICVFGCGGERDRGKRPQMAAIAETHADRVIVTDDNPRGEDGAAIVAEIHAGFRRPAAVVIERDRTAAIQLAVRQAAHQDTVLIAGKGHETYQEIGGRKLPFNDSDIALRALESQR